MIDIDTVRDLVSECLEMGIPMEIDYDTPIVVDSFSMVWVRHLLEQRHGIEISPDREALASFSSVRGIHGYLATHFPDKVAAE